MSKHERVLAITEEQIEAQEKVISEATVKLMKQRADVERTEKEVKFLQWSLDDLRSTRDVLVRDASMSQHPSTNA